MTYGELIKKARIEAGLKQYQFADAIGVSKVHISLVERGHSTVGIQLLEKVAKFKGVPVSVLLWELVTIDDVPEQNRELYAQVKQTADMIINNIFKINEPISI
jgi:transcriptional regulator with XRE-family HTH domain